MHEGHRERLISKLIDGKSILSDHEILEILLFYAIPRKNVNGLAHTIIDNFGSLSACFNADYGSLIAIKGVGHKTATFLITMGEIFNRMKDEKAKPPVIFSYDGCKQMLIDSFRGATEEKFVAFFLDKKGTIIYRKIFCSHSENKVDVDVSELLNGALSRKPYGAVICHNHLSGNPAPSYSDDKTTQKLFVTLKLHNIILHDHIIVSEDKTFSYHSSNRLSYVTKNVNPIIF